MSIKTQGLLVAVTITKPQLTAKDSKATADAENANNAAGAGQYRKDLYPKHLVAPITEVESSTRAFIRSQTMPWGVSSRLLPSAKFMDFSARLSQFETAFNQAVTVFMQNYANVMQAAQQQQGNLFDPSLYPDTTELRAQFTFAPRYCPITDDSDFRVQVSDAELDIIKAQVRAQVKEDVDAVTVEATKRLKAAVAQLAEVMGRENRTIINAKGYAEVKAPIFRDSVVENITEVTDLLKGFAAVLPPALLRVVDAAAPLGNTSPEALRNDDQLRASLKASASSLLAEIDMAVGGYLPAPPAVEFVPLNPAGLVSPTPVDPETTVIAAVTVDPLAALTSKLEDALFAAPAPTPTAPAAPAPTPTAGTPDWLTALDD